ncbi:MULTISPECIES: hypothetical protein [unclassified Burkholderia]|uniref:hypothetical protein n=1 Tax=unclassified Burkholderia TaxID=2613784 RepID=UPI000F5A41D9|nr:MULTISPECIES: hypothetical protein [unclassified Burkholderia]RQR31258.1 hypothetical protein DIE20_33140 [Burkholderia sp. Bp9131]RQR74843.1 hypothetical protein DIE12_11590 [Burkholderia sp. Bp9015]
MPQLEKIPAALAALSISRREIVLPLDAALECIDYCERHRIPIYGWEGWVLTVGEFAVFNANALTTH